MGLALALGACDSTPESAPGAVSEGEARALEEAAEMLDEQRLPDGVLPVVETAPADTSEPAAPPAAPEAPDE